MTTIQKTITLYRGDGKSIDEFKFGKTSSGCLLGKGIYLTDRKSVANSYRTKGTFDGEVLFEHTFRAIDKNEAWNKAKEKWLEKRRRKLHGWKSIELNKQQVINYSLEFDQLRDKNGLKLTRLVDKSSLSKEKGWEWFIEEIAEVSAGYLSTFVFPEPNFGNNLVNFDAYNHDQGFLEILDNPKMWKNVLPHRSWEAREYQTEVDNYFEYVAMREAFPRKNVYRFDPRLLRLVEITNVLRFEYGVHGFEYSGGQRLGGGRHRAFCVFDEDYVNAHRVSLER